MLFLLVAIIYLLTLCFNIPYSIFICIINIFIMLLIYSYKFINDIENDDTKIGYKKN